MIYHPESLLPRSAELNVTLDLWGGAFPVLETSARFEGLEIIWEKLFGPQGFFPDNHIQGLVQTPEEQSNEARNMQKRSIDNLVDVGDLQKKVALIMTSSYNELSLQKWSKKIYFPGREKLNHLLIDAAVNCTTRYLGIKVALCNNIIKLKS